MNNYFEHNLPMVAPSYVKGAGQIAKLNNVLPKVIARMEKLEKALSITGLCGEQFSEAAKIYFSKEAETGGTLIDLWTAEELAHNVALIAPTMSYTKRMEWPNAEVVVDTAFVTVKEWEAIRVLGIGGSDAAVVMGISPYRTTQELYHDKIGTDMKKQDSDSGKEFIFSYGHKVESLVIEEFCRRTGAKPIPETRMFRKKGMPFITANVDQFVEIAGKIFIFEAKTTTEHNRDAWQDNKVPVQYIPQCRQYMATMDDPRIGGVYIGCIYGNTPNDFRCSPINRDMAKEQAQLDTEVSFWENNVLAGIEPDPSGDPKVDIALAQRISGYGDINLPEMQLMEDDRVILEEYMALADEKAMYEKKKKAVEQRMAQLSLDIILELGTSTEAMLEIDDDKYINVTYKPRSLTSVDKEKLQLLYPDVYADVVSVNPENSRPFSVKVKKYTQKQKKERDHRFGPRVFIATIK